MTSKVVVSILSPVCLASAALLIAPLNGGDERGRLGLAVRITPTRVG